MHGAMLFKLANAVENVGFTVNKVAAEEYSGFDKETNYKYTGEIILKIRPVEDEEAERQRISALFVAREKEKNEMEVPL
jgi:hypothetical protein